MPLSPTRQPLRRFPQNPQGSSENNLKTYKKLPRLEIRISGIQSSLYPDSVINKLHDLEWVLLPLLISIFSSEFREAE